MILDPASEIELPRLGHRLPRHVLTASEAEQVMMQPNIADPSGCATVPSWKCFIRRASGAWN